MRRKSDCRSQQYVGVLNWIATKPNGKDIGFIKEVVTPEEEVRLLEWCDWRARNNLAIDVDVLHNKAKKYVKHPDFKGCEEWAGFHPEA